MLAVFSLTTLEATATDWPERYRAEMYGEGGAEKVAAGAIDGQRERVFLGEKDERGPSVPLITLI